MNPKRKRRLILVMVLLSGVAAAVGLGAYAMRNSIDVFMTPSDLLSGKAQPDQRISVGGLVVDHSLNRGDGLVVEFRVSDQQHDVLVRYEGILPDLFREGKGIMVKGRYAGDGVVSADTVLAKHDENYMPPEVKAAMEKGGHPDAAK